MYLKWIKCSSLPCNPPSWSSDSIYIRRYKSVFCGRAGEWVIGCTGNHLRLLIFGFQDILNTISYISGYISKTCPHETRSFLKILQIWGSGWKQKSPSNVDFILPSKSKGTIFIFRLKFIFWHIFQKSDWVRKKPFFFSGSGKKTL